MFNLIMTVLIVFQLNFIQYDGFKTYRDREAVDCIVDYNPYYIDCSDRGVPMQIDIATVVDLSGEGYKDYWVGNNGPEDIYIVFDYEWAWYHSGERLEGWIVFNPSGE